MSHLSAGMHPSVADVLALLGDTIVNLRDFGDMTTRDGRRVVPGRLFRSGHLGHLTPDGIAAISRLGITLVADLRFAKEREEAPSQWPVGDVVPVLSVAGGVEGEGPHVAVLRKGGLDPDAIDAFYVDFYRAIPFDPHFRALFAEIIRTMSLSSGGTLIHCSVGKDRTGILVALIQHMLGVPRARIVADYMETRNAPGLNAMVPEIAARLEDRLKRPIPDAIARKMLGVEEEYLLAALAAMTEQCDSIERYLEESGIGPEIGRALRARLLIEAR